MLPTIVGSICFNFITVEMCLPAAGSAAAAGVATAEAATSETAESTAATESTASASYNDGCDEDG